MPFIDNYFEKIDRSTDTSFNIDNKDNDTIYVYTDGACINNGKADAIAGIGIYFGDNDSRNVSERIEGKQTNNTAELKAIIKVFSLISEEIKSGKKIVIMTDSTYSIGCATKNRLTSISKKEIPNKLLVEEIYKLYNSHSNVYLEHIRAHTNKVDRHSIGNENADRLANQSLGLNQCIYNTKVYLNVPYSRKDEVKKLGGKWDKNKKKWFIYENNEYKDEILSQFSI